MVVCLDEKKLSQMCERKVMLGDEAIAHLVSEPKLVIIKGNHMCANLVLLELRPKFSAFQRDPGASLLNSSSYPLRMKS